MVTLLATPQISFAEGCHRGVCMYIVLLSQAHSTKLQNYIFFGGGARVRKEYLQKYTYYRQHFSVTTRETVNEFS